MEIRAFRGWHYRPGADGDVSSYIAPPYDVLTADDKEEFVARSERNIVAVDLPHVPPGGAGADEGYREAAERLAEWQASGVLVRPERPCLYVYEQAYSWGGREYVRRAMLCGVRGTSLGEDVLPHEHTFDGPKADRLKLTEHTRTQLSPIFGFYHDTSGVVSELLSAAAKGLPDLQGELRGVTERVWIVEDDDTIASISTELRDRPVFIADGHHRYTTAVNYRDALREREGISDDHEANFVLFALVAAEDPGLIILPTHRIVRGVSTAFSVATLAAATEGEFDWQRCSLEDLDLVDTSAFLRRYGQGAMAFLDADPAEVWIARLTDDAAMTRAAPDEVDAWRALDVAVLHKLIIDRAIDTWRTPELSIDYTPDARAVLAACNSGRGQLGVCLQATPLAAVEQIARAGASMPHKSTYFHPKVATGLVLKPLQ